MAGETERYNLIREKSGLSKKSFAESLGLSNSMNYQIMTGRIKLPRDLLDRLAQAHNVNLHWFLTGEGPSGLEANTVEIELFTQEAAAGSGKEIEEYAEKQYIPMLYDFLRPHNPKNLKAVHVSGDSMIGEHINDGDIAIFNTKLTEGNGIYVVSVGSTLLVKRVDFDPANKTIELISANPAYETRRFSGYELENIKVEGRVVACYHKL
ncbi:MAG: helix-turn-helix domain-containing protein [Treponema sp.]|jgi:SOS-response transcriptional repressor LexA|nr:helix-turn-helix domain-containing protein [Treponema sp.]